MADDESITIEALQAENARLRAENACLQDAARPPPAEVLRVIAIGAARCSAAGPGAARGHGQVASVDTTTRRRCSG